MNNFSLRHKLLFCFLGIALLSLPYNIYLMINFSIVTKNFLNVTDEQLPSLRALFELKNSVLRSNSYISNFNYYVDHISGNENTPTQLGAVKDQLFAYLEDISSWQKMYQQHAKDNIASSELEKLKNKVILKALAVFTAKVNKLETAFLKTRINELESAQLQLVNFIDNSLLVESEAMDNTTKNAIKSWVFLKFLMIPAYLFILSVAVLLSFLLSRWISKPIIALRNFMQQINQNNLNTMAPITTQDEIGELSMDINKMLENLAQAKTQIIEASRLAGVAEVATSIIHNAGNILNSINTSVTILKDSIKKSKTTSLVKVHKVLIDNKNDLQNFLEHDEKGKLFLPYFDHLMGTIEEERILNEAEITSLQSKLHQINQIVTMQLKVDSTLGVADQIDIAALLEDALTLQNNKINQYGIKITRHYAPIQSFYSVRSKLHQILVNLVKNAVESLVESLIETTETNKELILSIELLDNGHVRVKIKDNGMGISPENLAKIFAFGFTTKVNGHGYGLHGCALMAMELDGKLLVESDGLGLGATFILDIPKSM